MKPQRRLHDCRELLAPVVAAARVDADLLTLANSQKAETVVLDFKGPLRAGRDRSANGQEARLDEAHAALSGEVELNTRRGSAHEKSGRPLARHLGGRACRGF